MRALGLPAYVYNPELWPSISQIMDDRVAAEIEATIAEGRFTGKVFTKYASACVEDYEWFSDRRVMYHELVRNELLTEIRRESAKPVRILSRTLYEQWRRYYWVIAVGGYEYEKW